MYFEVGLLALREALSERAFRPSSWRHSELGEGGAPPTAFCPIWAAPAVLLEGVRVSVVVHNTVHSKPLQVSCVP